MDDKKTAIYIRLSDEDENVDGYVKAESNSVAAQRLLIRDYLQRNGLYEKDRILEYVDDGYSGTNFSRPSFQRMMADARQGLLSCIVVKDFSRFGRDHLETGNYLERIFPLLGIRFISVNDQFDSEDCQGMTGGMSVALKNIINAMYSRDLSKKVCTAMETRAERGEYMAAFPPYGYRKNPEDMHKLIPDEEAAAVVRMIFSMAADGTNKTKIARSLNEQEIPTPTEHLNHIGVNKKSTINKEKKLWSVTTISDMLRNEAYLGKTVWNKTRVDSVGSQKLIKNDVSEWIVMEGTHEPLISQELFDAANKKAFTNVKRKALTRSAQHPILFCAYCGRRLGFTASEKTYRCSQAYVSGIPECRKLHANRRMLEDAILSCTHAMADMAVGESIRQKKTWVEVSSFTDKIKRREAEQKRLSAKKLRLYEDYRTGIITKEQYRRDYEKASNRILAIEQEIPQLKAEAESIRQKKLAAKNNEAELKELSILDSFDKEKLSRVIDKIQVYSADRIELVWKTDNCFISALASDKGTLSLNKAE